VVRLLLAIVLAVASFGAWAGAQQAPPTAVQAPLFRSGANLVSLNVSVTDNSGRRFITDLAQHDFAVFEDGVQQQVTFFESSQVPVDLVLMLDTSSSMSDKMATVHTAAINFLRTLRPGDRGAVLTFSDNVQVLEKLTPDRPRLEQAVQSTTARGGTSLNTALYVALREFSGSKDEGAVRRRAIALLSDGEDTSSVVSFDDVLALARKSGVNIYTIALQSPSPTAAANRRFLSPSQYALKSLAQETGAAAFFPEQITQLQGVYSAIAQELSSQYSIGYSSSNSRSDGRFRRIVVRVVSHPEMRPRARTGYTANDAPPAPDNARR
jgi:Ca-activated chloride channel homolog